VVAFGVVFLLDAAGALDADTAIDHWWPVLLIGAGVLTLAERPPARHRGVALTAIGAVLLLFTTNVLDEDAWQYVWPIAIVAAGVAILWRWRGRALPRTLDTTDVVRSTAVLSGAKLASASSTFRGAWLTAVLGGVTLDLRDATPAPGGATINATAALGGIDVLVPRGWKLDVRCTPILGGIDDKTDHSVAPADDAPVLRIDAVCLLGGVDLKHQK
jgi:hypothetical protein